jgi:hypothetical protein
MILLSFACTVMGADLIIGSKIRSPAAGAFDVIVVGLVEPHSKAVFAGLLSRVVVHSSEHDSDVLANWETRMRGPDERSGDLFS